MIATTPISEVVLCDTINNHHHRFVFSDYLETTDKPEKDFYELLQTGKAELYKQYKKKLNEFRPYGSATEEQRIQTDTRFFVLKDKEWTKVKKLKDLTALLKDKQAEISKFIAD